jgi:sialic acid synthase SpsE
MVQRPQYIIAEAGNAHEGNLSVALELLERAKECGADMVKFQAGKAGGFARTEEQVPFYRKYELGRDGYDLLIKRGRELDFPVFFSVWSEEYADYRKLEWFKIPARQCNAENIRKYGTEKTFISVPHNLTDVKGLRIKQGIVMHCVSEYPQKGGFWWRMRELLLELPQVEIGFSDHFVGIDGAIHAAYMGAVAIEKHFTLAHNFGPLRDHALSATPAELRELVERVKGG